MTALRARFGHLVLFAAAATLAHAQGGSDPSPDAIRMGSPPSQTVATQQMWPAPTAEDWKKPCLLTWQRTWDDALAVAKETGKAILICVNMDGEPASEHYAGVRYRQPDIARLYEPYVCVIASVYRHTPRDYDDAGQRIPCPRFGTVTCSEHIWIEPILYEKYFEGRRIAPRHIMVELDGSETYDVFYSWDTDSVFRAVREGVANRPPPTPIVKGDRSLFERVASRDVGDRTAVESAFQAGDEATRRALLEAAEKHPEAAPLDLLRLGLRSLDVDLNKVARSALAGSQDAAATDLIADALKVPLDTAERDALIGALTRLGENSPRARTFATVHQGLTRSSSAVDVQGWAAGLGATYQAAPPSGIVLEQRLERAEASTAKPADAQARLEFAEATLAFASQAERKKEYSRILFLDAQHAADEARALGATGWRVDAAQALAGYYLGQREPAYALAEKAVAALPHDDPGWSAMAVLALFAEARQRAIAAAVREKKDWPAQWLADANDAYAVLERHPLGTDLHAAAHYDLLAQLGATGQAARVLDAALERFPDSWALHERLRRRVLEDKGLAGLEATYEQMLRDKGPKPNREWFAGYASLVTAEFEKRAGRDAEAEAAYGRAIAHYEKGIEVNPESKPTADHYVALALAGRARIALEHGDLERALSELTASFHRKPEAAATLDGLNLSPADSSRLLRARLVDAKREDLLATLEAELARLDPVLLQLPAYERGFPEDERPRGRRGAPGGQ